MLTKLWPKNKFVPIFIVFILCIISFIIGRIIKIPGKIHFQNELDGAEIISALISLVLAIYIVYVIERKQNQDRVEKDILIDYLAKIEGDLNKLSLFYMSLSGKNDLSLITNKNKDIGIILNRFLNILEKSNLSTLKCVESVNQIIKVRVKSLRDLSTKTPRIVKGVITYESQMPVFIEDNKVLYSDNRKKRIIDEIEEMTSDIFSLKIEINRIN
jgi:hypothetical protein